MTGAFGERTLHFGVGLFEGERFKMAAPPCPPNILLDQHSLFRGLKFLTRLFGQDIDNIEGRPGFFGFEICRKG